MYVAGVDEAGRGALAGPVVAAAIVFSKGQDISKFRDSKKLSAKQREAIFQSIIDESESIGIGVIHHDIIDRVNILQATYQAMNKAVLRLHLMPTLVLVDGNREIPQLELPQKTIVKGDDKIPLISAASIIAKVVRDRIMLGYAKVFPEYEFEKHKGYGTKLHMENIEIAGLSRIHRRSFNISKQLVLF